MVEEPKPDWIHKSIMVGMYNGEPILVTVDGLGQLSGGLGAYTDRYVKGSSKISTGSDINVDTNVVPAGELWVVTNICVFHNDPVARQVTVYLRFSTINFPLFRDLSLDQNEIMDRQGKWILKEGDYIRAVFVTPASGQTGYIDVVGYKTEVPT